MQSIESSPQASPRRGDPPPESSVGEVYLKTFEPPALASASEVYMRVYASVRAILESVHWTHATTAVQAAWDASVHHVNQALLTGGGPS